MNQGSDSTPMAGGFASKVGFRSVVITLVLLIAAAFSPSAVANGSVEPRFDLTDPSRGPFPSDRFTVPDATQRTGLRVNLPWPDCAVRRSDCEDIEVLNTLDGFNLQPRLSVPFTGPIDPATVSSDTVFLFKLSCTICPGGRFVGINQAVWDPGANTVHVESDQLLDQDARYLLVVTNGIRDPSGERIDADQFRDVLHAGQTSDPAEAAYREQLLAALDTLQGAGVQPGRVAAASIFTTQSATAVLEKIRDQIKTATPAPTPADFAIGTNGERAVFALADITSVVLKSQDGTAPTFTTSNLPLSVLRIVPGAVGTIASGKYLSPSYQTAAGFIPPAGTLTGPAVHGMNEVYFILFLPAGPAPPRGWPVAIVGHGGGTTRNNAALVAAKLAKHGIAAIAINVVGYGGGPLGTLTVTQESGDSVTFPAGGRGIDQNGDGIIGGDEGFSATPPRRLIMFRDGLAQTAVDLMQLVREIQVGIDVNDDGAPDLDSSHISYLGISLGGFYGTDFVAVEPAVRASVLNVTGGPVIDVQRVSSRPFLGQFLSDREPSLLNGGPDPLSPTNPYPFNENLPLRNEPPVVNDVPGAIEIQAVIERIEWAMQASNPVAYAPYLRKEPLPGLASRPVLFSFAKGDPVVPNPTSTAVIRAGDLTDQTSYFRNDIAYAANPAIGKNPHVFLVNFSGAGIAIALAAQEAIATFLASDGQVIVDPDGAGPLFETPIGGPLPETLQIIP